VNASLYIHIPFCLGRKCDYCDFFSLPVTQDDRRIPAYIERLLVDAEQWLTRFQVRWIPTVYIGGGTPSILGAAGMGRLLTGIAKLWDTPPQELTVEANPETADEAFLASCREGGVTRLSLGVQTFHEASRRAVHRQGTAALLRERLKAARAVFGSTFSADLMTGLPFQDEAAVLRDIETLLAFEPGHVSLYALTPEPGTPLAAWGPDVMKNLPQGDAADELWLAGRSTLEKAGYRQYEVSNFSLPGHECLHNLRYWRMENWIGLGPGASSTLIDDETGTGLRYTFRPDLGFYMAAMPPEEEELDRSTLMEECLFMGFRCLLGPDAALFKRRFGLELRVPPEVAARWGPFMQMGKTALTSDGLLFHNAFMASLA
jgi:oxygen-independent coproporphyrinogen-3 oxidase